MIRQKKLSTVFVQIKLCMTVVVLSYYFYRPELDLLGHEKNAVGKVRNNLFLFLYAATVEVILLHC